MAIYAEAKEQYKLAPAGQFQAVCCEVLDLGYSTKVYKDPKTGEDQPRNVHEIQYVFQINQVDADTGKRFEVRSQPFNLILSEKASLRKFLLGWRGHDLTPDELKPPGVDVDLTGRNAMISIIHNQSGDKTYANIGAIMPLFQGMPEIEPLNYQSKQDLVNQAKAAGANGGGHVPSAPAPQTDAVGANDPIPF